LRNVTTEEADTGTIVVGFDGSPHARAALELAAREALSRGLELRIVTSWHVPSAAYGAGLGPAPGFDPHEIEESAGAVAAEALELLGVDAEKLTVETRVREGNAGHVLVEEAEDAETLVVGSRGHGTVAGLLLGSVSQHCAAHARCPVVIVHAPPEG
jgi:nucleotide-binding universal stress UspA family protein